MKLEIRNYTDSDASAWDEFSEKCLQATFLHSRNFISYHGDRFNDQSLIIHENGKWVAVLPAAISESDKSMVISHPGISYGGVLHNGQLKGEFLLQVFLLIKEFYLSKGFSHLLYKPVPSIYHVSPAQDDLYSLFRLGARRVRCDLSSTIDLSNRMSISDRRRRGLKKFIKSGASIVSGQKYLKPFWNVLSENLNRKHSVSPVHNINQIHLLAERFPNNISCICAELDNQIESGVVIFSSKFSYHAQYIASSEIGYDFCGLDGVFEGVIQKAIQDKKRWFDFGICTEKQGLELNSGLYQFKSEFGGGGTIQEFFELDLRG